jgi:hypothetical protein
MPGLRDFKTGDIVRHIGMREDGEVVSADAEVKVRYKSKKPTVARPFWYGIYDEVWFRQNPTLLVRLDPTDTGSVT